MKFFKPYLKVIFATILVSQVWYASGQSQFKQKVRMSSEQMFLSEALIDLSEKSGVNIFFSNDLVRNIEVRLDKYNYTFESALTDLLFGQNIYYKKVSGNIVLYKAIRKANKHSISGYIEDHTTGERLEYATIHDFVTARGTETNGYGFYSISLPEGEVDITCRYIGYQPELIQLKLERDTQINISLRPSNLIDEIIVRADSIENTIIEHKIGQNRFQVDEMKRVASLGGELDLYRYMELIPGINTGTDGIGGIHVRGGTNDQNLILMDGVPIYNPAHLIGIFSVFNPEAVKQVDVYKANFPARYGGRLSSIMDIKTKEGNNQKFTGGLKVGLASVNAIFEGPLFSEKSSFMVTGRWFLPSLFFRDISAKYKKTIDYEGDTYLNFYDLNVKWNWRIGQRDRVYLSYYQGKDLFEDNTLSDTNLSEEITIDGEPQLISINTNQQFEKNINWGNRVATLRWNHQFNDKIFLNSSIFLSRYVLQSFEQNSYEQRIGAPINETRSGFDIQEFTTSIEDLGYRLQIDMMPSLSHLIKVGGFVTSHTFLPKSITFNEESKINDIYIEEGLLENTLFSQFEINATEWGLFFEDDWSIIPDELIANIGTHIGGFWVKGKRYTNPQLRALLNYMPSSRLSIQVGFSQMTQYLHLLTNSGIGLPTDLWVPATDLVEPQKSAQFSLGMQYRPSPKMKVGIEGYLKNMKQLIAFQEGASFLVPAGPLATSILDAGNWENKITTGEGISKGVESEMSYETSRLYTRASYAYSIADRNFPEINFGESFPYRYNREHSATMQITYQIGRKTTLKANWIYGTGNHITLAESKFSHPGDIFPEVGLTFGSRNGYELPAYHRLDLGVEFELQGKSSNWSHSLFVDVYNVYNRENPFYISLVENPVEGTFSFKQFSVFRVLPSIGYSVRFH